MTEAEGLPDAVIYTVFEDQEGRIWTGTSQGISLYNPKGGFGSSTNVTFLKN